MKKCPLIKIHAGKAMMAKTIISLFPDHNTYIEPFVGGGAVFFKKPKADVNVLNDINTDFIATYKVFRDRGYEIINKLNNSLYGRELYNKSCNILKDTSKHSDLDISWAVIYSSSNSFRYKICNGFSSIGLDSQRGRIMLSVYYNYINSIHVQQGMLSNVTIENLDATDCIKKYDENGALFYCDPPYINTACDGLGEYTQEDFINLLEALPSIKGKFILSCFDNTQIREFLANNIHCNVIEYVKQSGIKSKKGGSGKKTELIVTNL